MERLKRIAIILRLSDLLQTKGSWCSEAFLQKAVYFLQEITKLPTNYEFIFYKHSPLSFELKRELNSMRADQMIEVLIHQDFSYPCLCPTQVGKLVCIHYQKDLERFDPQISFVVDHFGNKPIGELEMLATYLYYVAKNDNIPGDIRLKAEEIHKLRPNFTKDQAIKAIKVVDEVEVLAKELIA